MSGLIINPQSALANHQQLWWDDQNSTPFATFGANATIIINTGAMDFINNCAAGGVNDQFFPYTDIYIVPSGTVTNGSKLTDIVGTPNTVQGPASGGTFIHETIGFTAPTGKIGPGRYAVVYDECQNGQLDIEDKIFDPAFEVVIADPTIPALPSFNSLKAQAIGQEQSINSIYYSMKALLYFVDFYKYKKAYIMYPIN